MSDFILKGYNNSIYSPKGLKEFISKEYKIPGAKEDKDYQKIHKEILGDLSTFEQWFKKIVPTLKGEFKQGETRRYSHQFVNITSRDKGKKYPSDIDNILVLGKATDNIIKNICDAASKIKDTATKKEYLALVGPIAELHRKHPANNIASGIHEDYLATDETKDLMHHFLKRDTKSRGDEDVNLGTTLVGNEEYKLPTDIKLTNNSTLAMPKKGGFYYVKIDGKICKYNKEGKKIGEISQGSFGEKSVGDLNARLQEVWGI